MPRPTLSATTTVTQTTQVKLAVQVKQMLKTRCEEHAKLIAEIKEREARKKRICAEVQDIFAKADQDAALEDGTDIDGHKIKMVRGKQKTLDKMGLLQAIGLTPDELDAFYDEKPKKAYIKISAPGEKEESE